MNSLLQFPWQGIWSILHKMKGGWKVAAFTIVQQSNLYHNMEMVNKIVSVNILDCRLPRSAFTAFFLSHWCKNMDWSSNLWYLKQFHHANHVPLGPSVFWKIVCTVFRVIHGIRGVVRGLASRGMMATVMLFQPCNFAFSLFTQGEKQFHLTPTWNVMLIIFWKHFGCKIVS